MEPIGFVGASVDVGDFTCVFFVIYCATIDQAGGDDREDVAKSPGGGDPGSLTGTSYGYIVEFWVVNASMNIGVVFLMFRVFRGMKAETSSS